MTKKKNCTGATLLLFRPSQRVVYPIWRMGTDGGGYVGPFWSRLWSEASSIHHLGSIGVLFWLGGVTEKVGPLRFSARRSRGLAIS